MCLRTHQSLGAQLGDEPQIVACSCHFSTTLTLALTFPGRL
jgi:hypothetical protein